LLERIHEDLQFWRELSFVAGRRAASGNLAVAGCRVRFRAARQAAGSRGNGGRDAGRRSGTGSPGQAGPGRAGRDPAAAEKAGGKIIHVTPPTFDPQPIQKRTLPAGLKEYRQPYVGYNEVLDRYSDWLLAQRKDGWEVIDLHGPMIRLLAEERKKQPNFVLAEDGVHMNAQGHWLAAQQILLAWGAPQSEITGAKTADDLFRGFPQGEAVWKLCQQRQRLLKDAWLTEVGHRRPGMKPGLPLAEAQQKAEDLTEQIRRSTPWCWVLWARGT
jgi:hypothetical protein